MQARAVLLTGASSGIGAATARALAPTSRLFLVGRDEKRLQAVAEAVRELGGSCALLACDLSAPEAPQEVVARALEAFGDLEALVNNAGIFVAGPAAELDVATIERTLAINLRAPMLLSAAALPALRRSHGMIVNISSIVCERSFPACALYTASKAALEGWSRVLREEERAHGVRVAVLAPGPTDTPILAGSGFDPDRMLRAGDVARSIVHLLDAPASASIERLTVMPPSGTQ